MFYKESDYSIQSHCSFRVQSPRRDHWLLSLESCGWLIHKEGFETTSPKAVMSKVSRGNLHSATITKESFSASLYLHLLSLLLCDTYPQVEN